MKPLIVNMTQDADVLCFGQRVGWQRGANIGNRMLLAQPGDTLDVARTTDVVEAAILNADVVTIDIEKGRFAKRYGRWTRRKTVHGLMTEIAESMAGVERRVSFYNPFRTEFYGSYRMLAWEARAMAARPVVAVSEYVCPSFYLPFKKPDWRRETTWIDQSLYWSRALSESVPHRPPVMAFINHRVMGRHDMIGFERWGWLIRSCLRFGADGLIWWGFGDTEDLIPYADMLYTLTD